MRAGEVPRPVRVELMQGLRHRLLCPVLVHSLVHQLQGGEVQQSLRPDRVHQLHGGPVVLHVVGGVPGLPGRILQHVRQAGLRLLQQRILFPR